MPGTIPSPLYILGATDYILTRKFSTFLLTRL